MAKLSMINREVKRRSVVKKYAEKRAALKTAVLSVKLDPEQKMQAQQQLQKLPRNANPCRLRNRCQLTGRPHGYYRKFGLGRNKLREVAMQGLIPGLVKASW